MPSPKGKPKASPKRKSPPRTPPRAGDSDFLIVGIGASAGGVTTLKTLFSQLPSDRKMAFVVIQHLSPSHFSMLAELIQNSTRMPVVQVQSATRLQSNHVYVMPPNANLALEKSILHLKPIVAKRGHNMPVDAFFNSLAKDAGGRAVGIVLSGMASDGTLGLQKIQSAGGTTLVQDPSEVEYKGMPEAAIKAGAADHVLPIKGIAKRLEEIAGRTTTPLEPPDRDGSEGFSAQEQDLKRLYALVRQRAKIDFSLYKYPTVYRRISRRMDLHRIQDFAAYLAFLEKNPLEIDELCQDLLINVTGFFRDGDVFETLKTRVFPEIMKSKTEKEPIKLWVPGCSTGEEVYSLVMTLHEFLGDAAGSTPILAYGTDVSTNMIARARSGVYSAQAVRGVSPERLKRFFVKEDSEYRLTRQIRERCIFSTQNVTTDPPIGKLDLLSCRNVMIYLRPELQARVLTTFHYALVPGGFLVLGSSEGIGPMARLFSLHDKQHKIYLNKKSSRRVTLELPPGYEPSHPARPDERFLALPPPAARLRREPDLAAQADRMILAHYAPPGILINRDMEIIHFRGSTGRYLEGNQGPASLNLMKMARDGLMPDLRLTIQKAFRKEASVRKDGLRVRSNGHVRTVDIEVVPMSPPMGGTHCLVLFLEHPEATTVSRKARTGKKTRDESRELETLHEKLAASQSSLQSLMEDQDAMREELQSSNEEVLSSNEELQSTNEELETAKEELQSSNEELSTMNDELSHRNEELSKVNDDLNNLLSSFHIPIIIVDQELRIRRFTPMAGKLMNLIATDVDRPITDIAPNIRLTGLGELLRDVVDNVVTRELDLQDATGHWFSLRIRPYRTADRKIDGAVIVLIDIDALKRVEHDVVTTRDFFRAVVDAVRDPIVILRQDFRVREANAAFLRFVGLEHGHAKGKGLYELSNRDGGFAGLKPLLETILPKQGKVAGHEFSNEYRLDAHSIVAGGEKCTLLVFAPAPAASSGGVHG